MNVIANIILLLMLISTLGLVANVLATGPAGVAAALGILAIVGAAWTVFWHLFKPRS